jgi:hypothetical protein
MGSNQIVHNRGRALAYLGNAEKKRSREELAATGDPNVDSHGEQAPQLCSEAKAETERSSEDSH